MKVVRMIEFEVEDGDEKAVEQLKRQMIMSCKVGVHDLGRMTMTVTHVAGVQWPEDGSRWGGPMPRE